MSIKIQYEHNSTTDSSVGLERIRWAGLWTDVTEVGDQTVYKYCNKCWHLSIWSSKWIVSRFILKHCIKYIVPIVSEKKKPLWKDGRASLQKAKFDHPIDLQMS